jgi:hypothetical protein
VRSRNLENEEAKARYRAVKIQPQWVVTPGKQTNIEIPKDIETRKIQGVYSSNELEQKGKRRSEWK